MVTSPDVALNDFMLTPSEANKIKKGILAASEVAKCRICRKVIETLRIYRLHYYTDEQVNHFLDLCQKTDFEAATTYYVNTMLAGFKKKEPILYQSDLVSRSADLVMVHDINPNSKCQGTDQRHHYQYAENNHPRSTQAFGKPKPLA